eukprot:gene60277-82462_t
MPRSAIASRTLGDSRAEPARRSGRQPSPPCGVQLPAGRPSTTAWSGPVAGNRYGVWQRAHPQDVALSARRAALDGGGRRGYGPAYLKTLSSADFRVLKAIFTWWNGATIGQKFHIGRRGVFIGQDELGNRYYEARDNRDSYDDRKRRW